MIRAADMLALLALAGCAAAPQSGRESAAARAYRAELAARFVAPGVVEARIGGTARLGDFSVRPLAVLEDSRCPRDVTCVWAGRVRIRAAISGVPGAVELVLGAPFALPRPSAGSGGSGGTLTLVAAAPEPWQTPPPGIESGPATRFGFRRD